MYVLGIHGSPTLIHEESPAQGWPFDVCHDASAVLLRDGDVVAGVAQERIDRVKYSNAFPIGAIRFCLDHAGIRLSDISHIAYPSDETVLDELITRNRRDFIRDKSLPLSVPGWGSRSVLQYLLEDAFDIEVPPERIVFVSHHHAHAMSAFVHSGFDEALIYVRDGWGDDLSGIVALGKCGAVELLQNSPMLNSLGHFYLTGTQILGYHLGDEYKVMGLAPYGNPTRYQPILDRHTTKTADGAVVDLRAVWNAFTAALGDVRGRNGPFEEKHQDVAATFQKALEDIAFRELCYWKERTGQKNICCVGGVAQNCSLNGRILASGMFENVFVPAAPGDGGLSLGAALSVAGQITGSAAVRNRKRLRSVSWGMDISEAGKIEAALRPWCDVLRVEHDPDIVSRSARALAEGRVIGWVRGRSEFGPRALGNRSILADPRPAENRMRINEIVKKRESFRPFAPSVIEEEVARFFDVQQHDGEFAFMTFVVTVREQYRALLGAVTHIDGSARIQSISKTENPYYWELISRFGKITDVPMLLNTSFNNNAEPIVETVDDAVACFLTTKLNHLIIGDYWVEKTVSGPDMCTHLLPVLPVDFALEYTCDPQHGRRHLIKSKRRYNRHVEIDESVFDGLKRPVCERRMDTMSAEQLYDLWCKRVIRMVPPGLAQV
jgi:carbamoyltransferase